MTIPNSVTIIGGYAFSGCSGLTSVDIPNSVTSIRSGAFQNCSGLTSINLGNSLIGIGDWAFYNCSGLTSIEIPNSVTRIDYEVFFGCSNLNEIHISDIASWCNIYFDEVIGCYPFEKPYHLYLNGELVKDLIIPQNVSIIGYKAFWGCIDLISVTIPESVKSIGGCAFSGCTGLTSVTIPNSVTNIGYQAFGSCSELLDVYCLSENLPSTDVDAFKNSYIKYVTLHVPESSIEAYKTTAPWSGFGAIVPLSPHKLTYYVDGEVYKTYLHEEGIAIPAEEAPEKEGYTFSGWSETPAMMPDHDVEVTGTFTINKYNLTYMVDSVEYKTVEIEYGAEITPEDGPEKEGYTFTGWDEIPETMPANDVTVTGIYEKNLLGKCATPIISYANNELTFTCETEDVEFVYDIKINGATAGKGNKVQLKPTYTISVYATKEDYENSDVATKEITVVPGDISGDEKVDATDITRLIEILLKRE